MPRVPGIVLAILIVLGFSTVLLRNVQPASASDQKSIDSDRAADVEALAKVEQGRRIFRYDTFGDQDFWGQTLQLHKAIEGQKLGGVGPGVSPVTALAVGFESRP